MTNPKPRAKGRAGLRARHVQRSPASNAHVHVAGSDARPTLRGLDAHVRVAGRDARRYHAGNEGA